MDSIRHLLQLDLEIRSIWRELDDAVSDFASAAKYSCIPGCGECCEHPDIEVSVLDCIPTLVGAYLKISRERGIDAARDHLLELADEVRIHEAREKKSPCPYYRGGSCGTYPTRPTLCRLFSFGSRRSKAGDLDLVLCRRLRETCGSKIPSATPAGDRDKHVSAPVMEDWTRRVAALDFGLGTTLLPIGEAMRSAAVCVLQAQSYGTMTDRHLVVSQDTGSGNCQHQSQAEAK